MKNILIVGAGPSAYISALTCLEFNLNVSILNPNLDQWKIYDESDLNKKIILKKRGMKELFRVPRGIKKIVGNKVEIFENFQFGGLSEIWGGVFLPPIKCDQFASEFNEKDLKDAIDFVEEKILIEGSDSEIFKIYKERKFKNQTIKSNPPIAKSSYSSQQNWSAKDSFKGDVFKGVNFIDGYLTSIKDDNKSFVGITYVTESGEEKFGRFDKVFLGTGVFGTARILLENMENIETILIEDSKTTFGIGFSLKLRSQSEIKKQMSPFLVQAEMDVTGDIRRFTQFYEISEELLQSVKFKYLRMFLMTINRIARNRFRLIMIFYPSHKSNKILIHHLNDKLVANRLKAQGKFESSFFDFTKIFIKNKIISLTPEISFKPGSGVHNGAFTVKMRNEKTYTEIKNISNIHILGSATMKSISAGPIMFSAMVNSRLVTKAVLE